MPEVLVNWSMLPKKCRKVNRPSRHDYICWLGRKTRIQTKKKTKQKQHFDLPDTPAFTGEHQFNHKCKEASYVAREHIFVDEISW